MNDQKIKIKMRELTTLFLAGKIHSEIFSYKMNELQAQLKEKTV